MRAASSYLGAMAILPPTSSPLTAIRDFAAVMRGEGARQRILGLTLSVLITIIILILFFVDSKINTAPPPRVVYVETYSPDRTDAEIIASQKRDQAKREADAKEHQRQMQQLQKRLGIE